MFASFKVLVFVQPSLEDRLALQEDFGSNIKNIQILPRGNDNKGGVGEQSIVGRRREGG